MVLSLLRNVPSDAAHMRGRRSCACMTESRAISTLRSEEHAPAAEASPSRTMRPCVLHSPRRPSAHGMLFMQYLAAAASRG